MILEKTLDVLYELGFQPEFFDENIGYRFEYEGLTLLLTPEDEDAETIFLVVPAIFDVTDENRVAVLEAMAKLAGKVKFVQLVIISDSVWLNYQHYLGKQEPNIDILGHMIRVLAFSTVNFHKYLNNEGDDE